MQAILVKGNYVCNVAIHYKEDLTLYDEFSLNTHVFSSCHGRKNTIQ